MAKAALAEKAALLGHPVSHSLSPAVYAALSRLLARPLKYKTIDVKPADLAAMVDKLAKEGYVGVNITLPHKRAMFGLSSASPEARAIGAINCLKLGQGSPKAHNTDAAGFSDALSEAGFKARNAQCQIFGAGGAARAVGYALGRSGAKRVTFWARKPGMAQALAADLSPLWPDTIFSAGLGGPAELWVNATPMGLEGFPEKFPVKALVGGVLAFDLVYGRPTKFLELGKDAGARPLSGISMLVYQGIRAWELWFGAVGGYGREQLKKDVMRIKKWR
jgi:shikimate dehydrogenase